MEEKLYDVILLNAGISPFFVINTLTETFGMESAEARALAAKTPSTLRQGLSKEDAELLINKLKRNEAEASLKESSDDNKNSERFSVILTDIGSNKTDVIIFVKNTFDLSLMKAKILVEGAPCAIRKNLSKEHAEYIKEKLEAAGATVTIEKYTPGG